VRGPPTPCLIGATASGKTDVGIHAARRTRGEVVVCDAFAVYRGMEILAAAPRAPADVPHHLVGCLDPEDAGSAARFVADCDAAVDEIRARGRTPWIAGGTALYLRSWLKGLGARVPRDPALRRALIARAEAEGDDVLHAELAALDPARAAQVHPRDRRRVVRALEIIHSTGRPASDQRREWSGPDRRPARLYGLRRRPDDLASRIARRTRAMFEAGVVEEARALLARRLSGEAAKALGLDVLGRLLAGETTRAEAEEEIVRRTRRFARKQATFFASFEGVAWLDVEPDEPAARVAERVVSAYADSTGGTSA
jgi:tRNA dimethylallyltransferase